MGWGHIIFGLNFVWSLSFILKCKQDTSCLGIFIKAGQPV